MKFLKFRLAMGISLCMVAAVTMLGIVKVYALPGNTAVNCGYFHGRCAAAVNNSYGQVLLNAGNTDNPALPATTDKAAIINQILAYYNGSAGGQNVGRNSIGAAFVIQLMRGSTDRSMPSQAAINDWVARINQPAVTLAVVNQNYLGYNSGWQKAFANDDAFFAEGGSAPSIDFFYNGALAFVLKIQCGNPLGDFPNGIPEPPATATVSGYKVGANGQPPSPATSSFGGANVTVTNTGNSTANPFIFGGVPVGLERVTAAAVAGFDISYTWCQGPATANLGSPSCPPVSGAGNTFVVNVGANNHVDVRFFYTPQNTPFTLSFSDSNDPSVGLDDPENPTKITSSDTIRVAPSSPAPNGIQWKAVYTKNGSGTPYCTNTGTVVFSGGSYKASDTCTNNVAGGTYVAGDQLCVQYTFTPGSGLVNSSGTISNPGPPLVSPQKCAGIINKPYFKVYGGDMTAGEGITRNGSCTGSNTDAVIKAWNRDDVTSYNRGAGVELAALASGSIMGFASNQQGGTTLVTPGTGLSFANTTNGASASGPAADNYGGSLTSFGNDCLPDLSPDPSIGAESFNGVVTSAMDGIYTLNSPTPNLHGTVSKGHHVTVYVVGSDVFIDSNIRTNATLNPGDGVSQIPSFTLVVVGGNIYVGKDVTQLDGSYVAETQNGTGGTLYTCAVGRSDVTANAGDFAQCNTKLTFTGAVAASNIKLYRWGAQSGKTPSLRGSTGDGGVGNNASSEEFDYSPWYWLSQSESGGNAPYDSITSLPPVL